MLLSTISHFMPSGDSSNSSALILKRHDTGLSVNLNWFKCNSYWKNGSDWCNEISNFALHYFKKSFLCARKVRGETFQIFVYFNDRLPINRYIASILLSSEHLSTGYSGLMLYPRTLTKLDLSLEMHQNQARKFCQTQMIVSSAVLRTPQIAISTLSPMLLGNHLWSRISDGTGTDQESMEVWGDLAGTRWVAVA